MKKILQKAGQVISWDFRTVIGTLKRYMKTKKFKDDIKSQSLRSKSALYFVRERYSASEIVTTEADR